MIKNMWSNLCLLKEKLSFVQMWTQSLFLWIVTAEVAESVEDIHPGDVSKWIGHDSAGTSTISEKVNNTIPTGIGIKWSEMETGKSLYYTNY